MNWGCELTDAANRDLRDLPKSIQKRVARVLDQMHSNPSQGDVKALRGDEWKGVFRRRLAQVRHAMAFRALAAPGFSLAPTVLNELPT